MMELNELQESVRSLKFLLTEDDYLSQWFDEDLRDAARSRALDKVLLPLIKDWELLRDAEELRNAPSK